VLIVPTPPAPRRGGRLTRRDITLTIPVAVDGDGDLDSALVLLVGKSPGTAR
jgi:hypothetical protein